MDQMIDFLLDYGFVRPSKLIISSIILIFHILHHF